MSNAAFGGELIKNAKLDNGRLCAQVYPHLEERQCFRLHSKLPRPVSRIW
jgi:hypothetical protein